MKILILIILIHALLFGDDNITYVKKTYYEGHLVEESYKNGQKHGMSKSYNHLGELESEIPYIKGKGHGKCKIYYAESGKLRQEYSMHHGKEVGTSKMYYENGNIRYTTTYKENNVTEKKRYYHSGALKELYKYPSDKPSIFIDYYPNGQIGWKRVMKNNKLNIDEKYPPTVTEYFKVALEGGERGYSMREPIDATKESLFNTPYKKIKGDYYLRIYNHLGYLMKETLYKNGKVFGKVKIFHAYPESLH